MNSQIHNSTYPFFKGKKEQRAHYSYKCTKQKGKHDD